MRYVDYFKAEVKYSGDFYEITADEWKAKADAVRFRGDAFDHSEEHSDESAKKLDGSMWVENYYPCNKLAVVTWAEIREEVD
jgi:hypothetical protein